VEFADVGDIVAIFKGDPWDSIRQLQWTYASSPCTFTGWVDDKENCRTKGDAPEPWASQTFKKSSAGPGKYSAVYWSKQKNIRILGSTFWCPNEAELQGKTTSTNFACPPDTGAWEATTGLFVCDKGQFSRNGQGPCSVCPKGTVSTVFAATECTSCGQGYYSSENRRECFQCPRGSSTLQAESLEADCRPCEELLLLFVEEETPPDIPFCAREGESINGTNPMITTTPPPDICGNGRLRNEEDCDDGNLRDYDGCSSICRIEAYFKCRREVRQLHTTLLISSISALHSSCEPPPDWAATHSQDSDTADHCFPACGDGVFDAKLEKCDDGNNKDGDGCDQVHMF